MVKQRPWVKYLLKCANILFHILITLKWFENRSMCLTYMCATISREIFHKVLDLYKDGYDWVACI